jgi:hypothetical protein
MAYALRYTITQILRNGNNQIIEIYQKDYTGGIVKTYQPASIILQPNSSVEYPYPAIISTQLNFSILLQTDDDYAQFPNVLTQDDRLYYVLLKENSNIMWRGFMFNDFSQVGYSTGITQADFVCVDGISYLQSIPYVRPQSINQLTSHLDVITASLNNLIYPDNINLIVACSYFAAGMANRADNVANEPFSQIYQYIRDFMGESYYDILNKIMTTFNCRLFQANGDWWICSMNEMAAVTNYYTKYTLSPTPVLINGGILNNKINIQPYADGNVHFINNSQIKILKKGFYNIQGRGTYETALNYCDNANLKLNDGTANAEGFVKTTTGTGVINLIVNATEQFDEFFLTAGTSGSASIEMGNSTYPYLYLPYIGEVPFKLSFDNITYTGSKLQIQLITSLGTRYLDTNKVWQTTAQTILLNDTNNQYSNYSIDIPPYIYSGTTYFGYLKFIIISNVSGYSIKLRNFIIQRGSSNVKYIEVNYNPSNANSSTLKVFEQPYGNNYPTLYDYSINKGVLCDSSGKFLKTWYSSTSTDYPSGATDLVTWITYQNIRNLNKNVATLECDLGSFKDSSIGYVYLDKVFTTYDTISGNLSYSNKNFIINRLTQNAYNNEVNSIQLIEVAEGQILPSPWFLVPNYITDTSQLGPFWNFQFNIITS